MSQIQKLLILAIVAVWTCAGAFGQTPTLIQHVSGSSTGQKGVVSSGGTYSLPLPNHSLPGNALIVCFNYDDYSSPSTNVTDDQNDTFVAGPSASDTADDTTAQCYYALNGKGGASQVQVHINNATASYVDVMASEFSNVAAASALDGSSGQSTTGNSVTPGSFKTTTNGDLIYQYASGNVGTGPTWTQGTSPWSLLSADSMDTTAAQYQVQTSAGTIDPTMTKSDGAVYISLGLALKAGNTGTPAPDAIHILRLEHINTHNETVPSVTFQFPTSQGNLIVIAFSSGAYIVTGITDSAGNKYVHTGGVTTSDPAVEMFHVPNALVSSSLSLTATMSGSVPQASGATFFAYEITGASTTPWDTGFGTNGFAGASGNQDTSSGSGPVTAFTATPSGPNELTIVVGSMAYDTSTGWSSPAGAQQIATTFTGEPNPTFADENNPAGVLYNGSNVSPQTWTFTHDLLNFPGVGLWSVAGAAFLPDPSATTPIPTTPSIISATAANSSQINLSWTTSTDSLGISFYTVQRCQGSGCSNFGQIASVAATSYSDKGLSASTTYCYRISATDNSGTVGGFSNVACVATSAANVVPGAITLVQHTSKDAGTTSSSTLAFPSPNTAGDWIAVVVRAGQTGENFTVQDSNGNTYKKAVQFNETGNGNTLGVFYAENVAGGSNTVSISDTASNTLRFAILEYSGIATSNSLDVTAVAQGKSTTPNSGSTTTTSSGDLLLGAVLTAGAATFTAGSGYQIEERAPAEPNSKIMAEDQIQTTAGSTSASASLAASDNWAAALVAFKAASSGAKPASPNITSVAPASGPVGSTVTISGTNFGSTAGTVQFNSTTATATSWTTTSIVVTVPSIAAGSTNIVVTAGGLASNTAAFTVTIPPPTISSLNPTSGAAGISVTITGTNFGTAQGTVQFNGTAATPTSWSSTSIAVTVPSIAAGSASVVVTVGGVASNSTPFTVTPSTSTTLTPKLIQHTSKDAGTTSSSTLAFPTANATGNWIAVVIRAGQTGEAFTVTDSAGNTYKKAVQFNETGNGNTLGVFYAENVAGGVNTVTVSDTTSNTLRFAIFEYSGIATSNSLDTTAMAQGKSASPNSGTATTSASGDLLLGAVLTGGTATFTAGSGYKIEESVPAEPNTKLIGEDQVQATAGAASATATLAASDNWAAAVVAFKAATVASK